MPANSGIQTVRDQEGVSGSQPSSSGVAPPGNQHAQGHGPQAGRLASACKLSRKASWRKKRREMQAAKKASAVGEGPSREPTREVGDWKAPRYDATCWIPPNTEESMEGKPFTEAEDRNILDWLQDYPQFDPHNRCTWLVMASHGRWPGRNASTLQGRWKHLSKERSYLSGCRAEVVPEPTSGSTDE